MSLLTRYRELPPTILFLITAQFLLNLVNSAFVLILNIYLRKLGFDDATIAGYVSYRFLAVLTLAFPLGLFIKGKALKPFFFIGTLLVPLASLLVLHAVAARIEMFIIFGFLLWGFGFMLMNVCALPYLMRATPEEHLSEAISLGHSTWSLATIISGSLITALTVWGTFHFGTWEFPWDEYHILHAIAILSLLGPIMILRVREAPPRSGSSKFLTHLRAIRHDYDWDLIFRALAPTFLIAIGAGLTIPFVNLFFNAVFHIDSEEFALIGSATAVLVFVSTLTIPGIKRRFGFRTAILVPQIAAVLMLVILALTELVAGLAWALLIAIICFMLRQPLMNMANPMTSELTMKYVGEKNQELISAITSSVWSGSWFLSARIFQILRGMELHYYQIFLITAALYGLGVLLYAFIIRDFLSRSKRTVQAAVSHP